MERMPDNHESPTQAMPILRLWRAAPTELIRPRQRIKQPDGPWIAHPDLISEPRVSYNPSRHAVDITMSEYRSIWNANRPEERRKLRRTGRKDIKIESIIDLWPLVDMKKVHGKTDHEIALSVERQYVGAHQYGFLIPILLVAVTLTG